MKLQTRYGLIEDLPKSDEWIKEENARRLQLHLEGKTPFYSLYIPLMTTGIVDPETMEAVK